MAIIQNTTETGNFHWYKRDGSPLHTIARKDGKGNRPTTLADAKKLGLLPSVTGITGVLHKEALMNWKARQIAMAAYDKPPQEGETLEYFMERILAASESVKIQAADLGSKVHDALEKLLTEGPQEVPEDMWPYVKPVQDWKAENYIIYTKVEQVVVNLTHGYAGKCDVFATMPGHKQPLVIDYKTRRGDFGPSMKPHDGQGMQLAAYAVANWGEDMLKYVKGINVYISSNEPGKIHAHWHESLVPHWEAFKAACVLWRHMKNYDPRKDPNPVAQDPQGARPFPHDMMSKEAA